MHAARVAVMQLANLTRKAKDGLQIYTVAREAFRYFKLGLSLWQSGLICTHEVTHHASRVIAVIKFCAHPPALGDDIRPAGQPARRRRLPAAHPGRPAVPRADALPPRLACAGP